MDVIKYTSAYENEWDAFVQRAKNGHFMFQRRYMEYHSSRFQDESLLFFQKNRLVAVLPAHVQGETLYSHNGLTFGGVLCDAAMTFLGMREVFSALKVYLKAQNIHALVYKAIPACYHQLPSNEDVAVLTQLGAEMTARDLVSVLDLSAPRKYSKGVKWAVQKAKKAALEVRRSENLSAFMQIMQELLQTKYRVYPTHSVEELRQLARSFPENIVLYGVFQGQELLGGTVVFVTEQVVHAQYIGMGEEGKALGATPYLLDKIFSAFQGQKRYFSFGTSPGPPYINEQLYYFKESMGARAMLQERYLLTWK
ncbi:GNAT family N-acetyltransferase [Rufibacter quisquiliarum]|uniref:BioF2-like acetyltransferase domain-containing protein n=1 Tax=Rufibacter quisquiliarum TaxID=1549639 RepID=A0A839GKK6_9BACT|nr:GNAT family N-acetyltransferase [Rufibacter quisquiliarum]MBA9075497.1 hypothetical protein [Rufibacter quisquiliarum]